MGLFWDDEEIIEIQKKLKASVNYEFSNGYLPSLFFFKPFAFAEALTDPKKVVQLLAILFNVMKKDGYDIKPLLKINFRAKLDKEPKYFESELYRNGSFGLCGRNKEGGHLNYGLTGESIKTPDEMWNAIINLKK